MKTRAVRIEVRLWLAWALLGIGLVGLAGAHQDEVAAADRAWAQCQSEISSLLVSPGSARFVRTSTVYVGAGAWKIAGYVDSQNKLGALLRSEIECGVNVTVRKLKLGDRVVRSEPLL